MFLDGRARVSCVLHGYQAALLYDVQPRYNIGVELGNVVSNPFVDLACPPGAPACRPAPSTTGPAAPRPCWRMQLLW